MSAANATGEAESRPLRLQFDRSVKLAFQGPSISSDDALLLHRDLDDALGLTDMTAAPLADPRTGRNGRRRIAGLLRQSIFSRLAGCEDADEAGRLCRDPVMPQFVGGKAVKRGPASVSAMGRFETAMPTRPENLTALADPPGRWIDVVHERRPPKVVTLDLDSSETPVHGDREGAMWHGHFRSKCLHPLFVFNQFGDLERCAPGRVELPEARVGVGLEDAVEVGRATAGLLALSVGREPVGGGRRIAARLGAVVPDADPDAALLHAAPEALDAPLPRVERKRPA